MKFKLPKTLAQCADLLYSTREKRLEIQKGVTECEAIEAALRDHIINTLPKAEATGVAGKLARVTIVMKRKPAVEDWEAFYAHVKKTGHFDLLFRRVNDAAVAERWNDNKVVPGVGVFNAVTLSVNKV